MARKHATRLILISLLFAACEGAEESQVGPTEVVSDPHTVCANGSEVAVDQGSRVGQVMEGDVDGDGLADRVWLSADASGPPGCRGFLTVDSEERTYWAVTDASEVSSSMQAPRLSSLPNIDGETGAEIVVNLEAGASTEFVGVFKLTRAGLERMSLSGRAPGPFGGEARDLFAYGGSVGHLEAVDCAGDGLVVISAALPADTDAGSYRVERRFFEAGGPTAALSLKKELTERHAVRDLKIDDFPEFASSPFGSCE